MNHASDGATPNPTAAHLSGYAALSQLAVIRAQGRDAAEFLQGQLTQNITTMAAGNTRLTAICNAKGRALASFNVVRVDEQTFWLLCPQDMLAPMLKRLSMFVLRSQVEISDISPTLAVFGLIGAHADPRLTTPAASGLPMVVSLPPADGASRALWLAEAGQTPQPTMPPLPPGGWNFAAVRSGVTTIEQAVSGAFVPQMLNYESADAIDFKKGCYPGQEIIARSQFRGQIKRRAFVGHTSAATRAGDDVYLAGDTRQPAGRIAQAAPAPGGGSAVIAVLKSADVEKANRFCMQNASTGPALEQLHIPYKLKIDL